MNATKWASEEQVNTRSFVLKDILNCLLVLWTHTLEGLLPVAMQKATQSVAAACECSHCRSALLSLGGCVLCSGAGWRLPGRSPRSSSVQIRMSRTRAAWGPISDIFSCLLDRAGKEVMYRTRESPPLLSKEKDEKEIHLHLNVHRSVTQGTRICCSWAVLIFKWLCLFMNIQQCAMSKRGWCNPACSPWRCTRLKSQ